MAKITELRKGIKKESKITELRKGIKKESKITELQKGIKKESKKKGNSTVKGKKPFRSQKVPSSSGNFNVPSIASTGIFKRTSKFNTPSRAFTGKFKGTGKLNAPSSASPFGKFKGTGKFYTPSNFSTGKFKRTGKFNTPSYASSGKFNIPSYGSTGKFKRPGKFSKGKRDAKAMAAAFKQTMTTWPLKRPSGLIFMCNNSTKEDCFRSGIFGMPEGKLEVVEQIHPGMKLFLFNTNTRLLHGVYEAVSQGAMDINPHAFRTGSFRAQVQFRVLQDGLPLVESEFKDAIKENYFAPRKFKTELDKNQVIRLLGLFQMGAGVEVVAQSPVPFSSGQPSFEVERGRGGAMHGSRDGGLLMPEELAYEILPYPEADPPYLRDLSPLDIELLMLDRAREAALARAHVYSHTPMEESIFSRPLVRRRRLLPSFPEPSPPGSLEFALLEREALLRARVSACQSELGRIASLLDSRSILKDELLPARDLEYSRGVGGGMPRDPFHSGPYFG